MDIFIGLFSKQHYWFLLGHSALQRAMLRDGSSGHPRSEPVRQNVHWLYSDSEFGSRKLRLLALIGLEQGVEFVNQNLLGNHTHNLIDNPTLFEKQQVGTAWMRYCVATRT